MARTEQGRREQARTGGCLLAACKARGRTLTESLSPREGSQDLGKPLEFLLAD